MLPKTEIEKYGGKGAILTHIRDNTDLPIPRYVIKNAGQGLDGVMQEFDAMTKPVIVRSSSPCEYGDFEGIFESVRDVNDRGSLSGAVERVEASATNERAQEYAKQNGFKINGKMHVIIQEQSPSKFCGAIMRHPNNPDLVFMTYFSGRGDYRQEYSSFLFNEKTQNEQDSRGFHSGSIILDDAKFLVEQYKKIESLEQITKKEVLFVEFGFDPFAIYQARPFARKQTADFQLPEADLKKDLWTDFVFGITPKEGIVLPVVRSLGQDEAKMAAIDLGKGPETEIMEFGDYERSDLWHNLSTLGMLMRIGGPPGSLPDEYLPKTLMQWHSTAEKVLEDKPYALVISSIRRDKYDTDLSVQNMDALIVGGTDSFLVHNPLRMFKKAKVTLGIRPELCFCDFFRNLNSIKGKVRIISNGKEGIAIRE